MNTEKLWLKIGIEDSQQKSEHPSLNQQKIPYQQKRQEIKQVDNDDFMKEIMNAGLPTYIQVTEMTQIQDSDSKKQIHLNLDTNWCSQNKDKKHRIRKIAKQALHSILQMKPLMNDLIENIEKQKLLYKESQINLQMIIAKQGQLYQQDREDSVKKYEEQIKKLSDLLRNQKQLRKDETSEKNEIINQKRKKVIEQQKIIFQLQVLNNQNELKLSRIQQNKNKDFQYQIQLQEKNQKLMKRIIENQKQNVIQEQKVIMLETDLKAEKNQNLILQKKIADLDQEIQERLNKEVKKIRGENHATQYQVYLRQIQKMNEEIQIIREKYHQRTLAVERRQEINMRKEDQIGRIESALQHERQYLQSFERELIVWQKQLKEKNMEIELEKRSISLKKDPYSQRFREKRQTQRTFGREKDIYALNPGKGSKSQIHFSRFYENAPQRDRQFAAQKNQGIPNSQTGKQKKLTSQIDELDTRLKIIQEQMKRQMQYLMKIQ